MNWVDLIFILIMLFSIMSSVHRGFIISALDLLCWAGSLVISFLLYGFVSSLFNKHIPEIDPWSAPLAFIILLVVSRILFEEISKKILKKISLKTHSHQVNRILGVLPGTVNGFLWITLLSSFLVLMPVSSFYAKGTRESPLNQWAVTKVEWLQDKMEPVFGDFLNNIMPNPNAAIGESESMKLPFKTKRFKERTDLEAEMLVLINEERLKEGLEALEADPELLVVARKHSADMFTRGYFSHITPEGKSPFQRMGEERVRYFTAGENLALAQTLQIAHVGLMNSPGHRANILRSSFGRVGIGILDGGLYGLMITQNFRN
jgi:uncharacterized protein YkwD